MFLANLLTLWLDRSSFTQSLPPVGRRPSCDPVLGLLEITIDTNEPVGAWSGCARRSTIFSHPTLTICGRCDDHRPGPADAEESLDLAGCHTRERAPEQPPFNVGTDILRRSCTRGRGLDGALLLIAGTRGPTSPRARSGRCSMGWSGQATTYAERMYNGHRLLGAGERLLAGESRLAPGESYELRGLTRTHGNRSHEMSYRFHEYLRARPSTRPDPWPVLINTWEAVDFRQDLDTLVGLARAAAKVGAQRFALDDGWSAGRRNDHVGLGDGTSTATSGRPASARSSPKYTGSAWTSGCGSSRDDQPGFRSGPAHPDGSSGPVGEQASATRQQTSSILGTPRPTTTSPGVGTTCSTPTRSRPEVGPQRDGPRLGARF